jgi:sugar porter (SP) family MFS transporter
MKNKIWFWSATVAMAGFLFGFDTAVISGAEQPIQQLWSMSDILHGWAVGMALWGTVIGALFGGFPTDKWGRKNTLIAIGILYFLSALGSALAWDPTSFMVFRFIGGLGVGASSVAAPTYISEIAPAENRGRLVILYQLNIVVGILIAYVSNYLLGGLGGDSWRWMLGIEGLPAIIYLIMVLRIPESPRWLLKFKNDEAQAREVLKITVPDKVDSAVQAIMAVQDNAYKGKLFSRRLRWPLLLAFLLAFFNQVSGINAIIYYAPRIFEMTGLGASTALLSTAGIGVVNVIFTFIGMYLIDRLGRRTLLIIGSIGYIISLALVARAFFIESYDGVPVFLFLFIAAHAIGQGAIIWVFISEIFPNEYRASGQAWGTGTHWVFAALISSLFPFFVGKFAGGPIFAFFAIMMVIQLFFALFMMPETKGVSLEELEKQLIK